MDLVDLIIVLIVALGGWNGYRTGLFRQITRLFGTVLAYLISVWLRPYVAPVIRSWLPVHSQTSSPGLFAPVLGSMYDAVAFAGIFIVSYLLLRYAAGLLDTLFSLPVLSTVNRLAGLAAGLALAIAFVYVAGLVAHYINNPRLQTQLNNSVIIQWLNAQPVTFGNSSGPSQ